MRGILAVGLCILCVACGGDDAAESPFVVATESGLRFWHFSGATGQFYMPENLGSGVALLDFDSDGDLDVFFLQGTLVAPGSRTEDALRPPPAGWTPGNRLFRNDMIPDGRLSFVDVTGETGDLGGGYGMGAAVGDFDNDGDPDLYVTGLVSNYFLRNDSGRFRDITSSSGTGDTRWNVGAGFVDFDIDGDLDLFVTAYIDDYLEGNKECLNLAGRREYCSPRNFPALPDRLFRNDGDSRFTDVSGESGIAASAGAGLGVVSADFNLDGLPDVYVANDASPNHLWINQGNGTFEETALIAGAAYNGDGKTEASMGVTAEDYDADGDPDLFMTHLSTETNTLYRNDGHGNFYDATDSANLGSSSIRYTGWGTKWLDADHDGDLDLFIANGAMMSGVADSPRNPYAQRNQLYLAAGERYSETPMAGLPENTRGAAFGDIDNDGDIDVIVSNNDGPAELFLNRAASRNHWLLLRLRGVTSNRDAAGARVALLRGTGEPAWRRVSSDGSFASANDIRVHFGLGDRSDPVDIGVVWPDGKREIWERLPADRITELVEGEGAPWP